MQKLKHPNKLIADKMLNIKKQDKKIKDKKKQKKTDKMQNILK